MDSSDQATILLPQVQRYRIPALSLDECAKQKGYIFCLTNVPLGAMIISIFLRGVRFMQIRILPYCFVCCVKFALYAFIP